MATALIGIDRRVCFFFIGCTFSGLITAAKAVASATTALVEAADGVVNGTHTMEQLVVAAHEVRRLAYFRCP